MIAFSMTDETYAKDMLHEVYEMNNDIVGFKGAWICIQPIWHVTLDILLWRCQKMMI
jgi:hypothetical protein